MSENFITIHGDSRHIPLADETVQTIITSPPYWNLRQYRADDSQLGMEETPAAYVANLIAVLAECYRILKPDGTLWLNLGDTYAGSAHGWCNHTESGDGAFRRPYLREWGGRKPPGYISSRTADGLKPKDLIGIPWRVAFALQGYILMPISYGKAVCNAIDNNDLSYLRTLRAAIDLWTNLADLGFYLRSDIIWHKPNVKPENVKDRPTRDHEYVFLLTKKKRYYFDYEAIQEPSNWNGQSGKKNYRPNIAGSDGLFSLGMNSGGPTGKRHKRSVWSVATRKSKYAHYAVMPEKLVEPCILAGSKPGDIVFDPFGGSGTVAVTAAKLGRIGIMQELGQEYIDIAHRRYNEEVTHAND